MSRQEKPRNPTIHQCQVCFKYHSIRFCAKFLAMDIFWRNQVVKAKHYCRNCLARTHLERNCKSPDKCRLCKRSHHTLLHSDRDTSRQTRPSRPVHERIGSRSTSTSRSNYYVRSRKQAVRTNSKQSQPPARPRTNTTVKRQPQQLQVNHTTKPDPQLLAEAIRSLAAVLCNTPTTSSGVAACLN